jgi:hypothetical protein
MLLKTDVGCNLVLFQPEPRISSPLFMIIGVDTLYCPAGMPMCKIPALIKLLSSTEISPPLCVCVMCLNALSDETLLSTLLKEVEVDVDKEATALFTGARSTEPPAPLKAVLTEVESDATELSTLLKLVEVDVLNDASCEST